MSVVVTKQVSSTQEPSFVPIVPVTARGSPRPQEAVPRFIIEKPC